MQVPPELEGVLQFILPAVTKYRHLVNQDAASSHNAVLAVRVGQRAVKEDGSTGLDANIGAPLFHSCLELLQGYGGWVRREDSQDLHEYFYTVSDGKVKTTVTFDAQCGVTVRHTHKTPVATADVKLVNKPQHAHIVVATDTTVDATCLPPMVQPYLVHLKKRWSFWLEKWQFNLTQVWSGVSRSVAEANQCRNFCTYELDIKCVVSPSTLAMLTDEYIALSLLLKLWSLLGSGSPIPMLPVTC